MDNNLVEQITREVLAQVRGLSSGESALLNATPQGSNRNSPAAGGDQVLHFICSNPVAHEAVFRSLGAYPPSKIICSDACPKEYIKNFEGRHQFINADNRPEAWIAPISTLKILCLSLNTMARLSLGVIGSFGSRLIFEAIRLGKRIEVTDPSVLAPEQYYPRQFVALVLQYRKVLEGYGIQFHPEGVLPASSLASPCSQAPQTGQNCRLVYTPTGEWITVCTPEDLKNIGVDRVSKGQEGTNWNRSMARFIDHTLLKAEATPKDVEKLCQEAKQYNFASVCVNPHFVALSARLLKGSQVAVCTVIGFPLGATSTITKVAETRDAIANGATEIDMVINVGELKAGNFDEVYRDILGVREACRGYVLKVILETSLLTREEKIKACEASKKAGVDFVKTSTGFSTGGATVEDIALMREVVGPEMGIKASGGIRTQEIADSMIKAGATRLGASASVAIVTGKDAGKGKY